MLSSVMYQCFTNQVGTNSGDSDFLLTGVWSRGSTSCIFGNTSFNRWFAEVAWNPNSCLFLSSLVKFAADYSCFQWRIPHAAILMYYVPVLMEEKGWNILKDNMHFHSQFIFSFWLSAAGVWGLWYIAGLVIGITASLYLLSVVKSSVYGKNAKCVFMIKLCF